jgi:hypothetical protein
LARGRKFRKIIFCPLPRESPAVLVSMQTTKMVAVVETFNGEILALVDYEAELSAEWQEKLEDGAVRLMVETPSGWQILTCVDR